MSATGVYLQRQVREGNALRWEGTYVDVASTVETDRDWTTEVLHFTVYPSADAAATFNKNSTDDSSMWTLTEGNWSLIIDEGDSDLSALSATGGSGSDGVYYYRVEEIDTDGNRHTRIFGELYVLSEAAVGPLSQYSDNINIFVTDADTINVTILTGATGKGVPNGGTAGQVLTKDSATDHDTSWSDAGAITGAWTVTRTAVSGDVNTGNNAVIYGVTDTTAPRTVTIDTDDAVAGRIIIVKDESGGAGTNMITVATEGSEKIDGMGSAIIVVDYGSLRLYSNGTNFFQF